MGAGSLPGPPECCKTLPRTRNSALMRSFSSLGSSAQMCAACLKVSTCFWSGSCPTASFSSLSCMCVHTQRLDIGYAPKHGIGLCDAHLIKAPAHVSAA